MRLLCALTALAIWLGVTSVHAEPLQNGIKPVYNVWPIGWLRKEDARVTIELDRRLPR